MARWMIMVVAAVFLGLGSPAGATPVDTRIRFDENSVLGFDNRRGPHLEVQVADARNLNDIVAVYTGRFTAAEMEQKEYRVVKLSATRAIVPYLALSPGFKRLYLQKLWPADKVKDGHLIHRVTYADETLWTVSQMYTGFGNNYRAIKKASGLRGDKLNRGMILKIPYPLLMQLIRDALEAEDPSGKLLPEPIVEDVREEPKVVPMVTPTRTVTPAEDDAERENRRTSAVAAPPAEKPVAETPVAEKPVVNASGTTGSSTSPASVPAAAPTRAPTAGAPAKAPEPAAQDADEGVRAQILELERARGELTYGRDGKGRYAEYRLKKGEAIYSSVVVRFCGLVRAQDVNKVAAEIIARNGIRDETDMPIGSRIRIPYDNLEPEFKAGDDPDYLDFLNNLEAVAAVSSNVASHNLDGVTVILDAGHGGKDPGASRTRVWEDDFVYDILCRVKQRLEAETNAVVLCTILDPSVGYKVQDVTLFRRDTDEHLVTDPPFPLTHSRATTDGVNLRWMYANHHYGNLVDKGADPDKILFASFHADALHHSIRGSMVYVPDGRHFPSSVSPPGHLRRYRESAGNDFNNSRKTVQRAQARSMQFAANFIKSSRERELRVHRDKPVRSLIYRNPHHPFVPAVIRFNRVPTRVLIEVCNLNNTGDQNLLKQPEYRRGVADAFVAAVMRTYGNPAGASTARADGALAERGE